MRLRAAILFLIAFCSANSIFSGFYRPNVSKYVDEFSAAWLVSISRFMESEKLVRQARNMAGVSLKMLRPFRECPVCHSMMTRDYLDFFVEHLSCTSNQIPDNSPEIFNLTTKRLKRTAMQLKYISESMTVVDSRQNQTLVVLVFSSISFSVFKNAVQSKIRYPFFEATFWSVYRYFHNIVIFVASEKDLFEVNSMNLPYLALTQLNVPVDNKNRTVLLPQQSLLQVMYALNDSSYNQLNAKHLRYVFFTEGDQIVHIRRMKELFDVIDDNDGMFAAVPHRMQTLPIMKTYPKKLHSLWPRTSVQHQLLHKSVVVENLQAVQGSCCDAGRNKYEKCAEGWWYNCLGYGLPNFTYFLRFGRTGFTMPTATAHTAICDYHADLVQCPLPSTCKNPVPKHVDATKPLLELCQQMPVVHYFGANNSYYMENHDKPQWALKFGDTFEV